MSAKVKRTPPEYLPFSKLSLRVEQSVCHIVIGYDLNSELIHHLSECPHRQLVVVFDQKLRVKTRQLVDLLKARTRKPVESIEVQAGEKLKTWKSIERVFGQLLKLKVRRDSMLIVVGGGSVGDAIGFVASTYLRGIDWIGVPTTLLSQVDSSVGGKTAINQVEGKNLIGTFHQPRAVFCDLSYLETLSIRELISGFGEMLKVALIFDRPWFDEIERVLLNNRSVPFTLSEFQRWWATLPKSTLQGWIKKSLKSKSLVVTKDVYDTQGVREVLNFGHTFGHVLETLTHYRKFQHGEAVIWGMRIATELSHRQGSLSQTEAARVLGVLWAIPVPKLSALSIDECLAVMANDKKIRKGRLHFVLLSSIGKASSDSRLTPVQLRRALAKVVKQ